MPRIARVVVPGMPHHITQRGIRKSEVFRCDDDRLKYLEYFQIACRKFLLRIWAYCLMTNHIHVVAVPDRADSLGKAFHWCHGRYDEYFNKKYNLTGNVWEGRPFSTVLDERHLWAAVRYVELNPVRAGMVAKPTDYEWSSARIHCGVAYDTLLDPTFPPHGVIPDWAEWLGSEGKKEDDERMNEFIRSRTATGRPCGDESFLRNIEQLTHRQLSPSKRGRKTKATPDETLRTFWPKD